MTAPAMPTAPSAADPAFARLKAHIVAQTGLAYYQDRDDDLAERVHDRMRRLRVASAAAYLALLEEPAAGEAELDALIENLTIGETFFFRHSEVFDALRDRVLPELIRANARSRRLRIWSAGCSNGAEPYSLAILLLRDLRRLVDGWDIRVVGTDINRASLVRAREALYEEWSLRGVPEDVRATCFEREGRLWRLSPLYRSCVTLQYHNLVKHAYPSLVNNLVAFDLVLCRNVMIYFGRESARRVVAGLYDSMVEGGWLVVGHSEPSIDLFRAFRTVNAPGAVLYQRSAGEARAPVAALDGHGSNGVAGVLPWTPPDLGAITPPRTCEPSPRPASRRPDLALVRSLADRGELEQAVAHCRREAEAHALEPAVHLMLGALLGQLGRHDEASRSLKAAVYLDRAFPLAHYHLGLVQQRGGQADQAKRSFSNALRLLGGCDDATAIDGGDGMTVGELRDLAMTNLAMLEAA